MGRVVAGERGAVAGERGAVGGEGELASRLEAAVFSKFCEGEQTTKGYKVKMRQLAAALRTPRAADIRRKLREGTLTAEGLLELEMADALLSEEEREKPKCAAHASAPLSSSSRLPSSTARYVRFWLRVSSTLMIVSSSGTSVFSTSPFCRRSRYGRIFSLSSSPMARMIRPSLRVCVALMKAGTLDSAHSLYVLSS